MITCTFENGGTANYRHVVLHVLALKDKKILLLKRAEGILEAGKWGFPGGFLDQGENLEKGVLRELKEETGYEGTVRGLFRINSDPNRKNDNGRNNVAFEYFVDIGEKTGKPDWEQTEVKWFEIDKIDLSQMAFDQDKTIEHLKKYLKGEVQVPIIE